MILVARPGPAAGDEAFGIKSADHTGFTVSSLEVSLALLLVARRSVRSR
jgi:hypothetical protein